MEWTETDSRGEWSARVTPLPPHRNSDGDTRREWVIDLVWPEGSWTSPDGHGIMTPEWTEGREALETLASFMGAWDEARAYDWSENRDLFPEVCVPFLDSVEEFVMAVHLYADDPANR